MAKQFHYVVMYDESTGKWSVEDETRYLDGNVYDTDAPYSEGWNFPYGEQQDIDDACHRTLEAAMAIMPRIEEE